MFQDKFSRGKMMLVSAIGYFNNANVVPVVNVDGNSKNQASKVNLTEGFGHFNDNDLFVNKKRSGLFENILNSFKSFISGGRADESSKYLSLIA